MKHFLLIYDRALGKLIAEPREFPAEDGDVAQRERFALESAASRGRSVEVVVLTADSLDVLKRTHARYFKSFREIATST